MFLLYTQFRKSYLLISCLFVLLLVSACSSEESTLSTQTENQQGIPIPAIVTAALPGNGILSAYIRVDNQPRQTMAIGGGTASITLSGLELGSHTITMEFEFTFDDVPDSPLMLASASKVVDVQSGPNNLEFLESEYDADGFDEDSDGIPNLTEINNGTNPFVDESAAGPLVTLSIDNLNIVEDGGTATITATLNQAGTQPITVNLSASGSASADTDYSYVNSISIPAGSLSGTTVITAEQDALDEADETIIIDISDVVNGVESGTQQVTITISDDDQSPEVTLSINTSTPLAEAGGVANLTGSLSTVSGLPVTVNLLYSGTATSGTDYTKSDTIVIPAGMTFEQATVTAVTDTIYEGDETIIVDIDSVDNGVEISAQQVTASITDDDSVPVANFNTASQSVSENAGLVAFTVELDHASAFDVAISYTVNGSATAADHDLKNGAINIAAGDTSGSTSFTIVDDTQIETDETVIVTLGNLTNAELGSETTQLITIYDNDLSVGGTISGLVGTLVLQNNGGDDLPLDGSNPTTVFTFTTTIPSGSSYDVTVKTQPAEQQCSIVQGSGIAIDHIATVDVQCFTAVVLDTNPFNQSVVLNWNDTGAVSYDLYYSTDPNCNIAAIASCQQGSLIENVTTPYEVTGLTNSQYYGFWLVADYPSGHATRSASGARPDHLIPNSFVLGVDNATDGTTYIGGNFTHIGTYSGGGIPFRTDSVGVQPFPVVEGQVDAVVSDGAGGWYIGGTFSQVGGITRNNLAHIQSDGSVGSWNPDPNGPITDIDMNGSTVYVSGGFTSIGGVTRFGLAAIDTSGTAASWNPNATALLDRIDNIAVSGSSIFVAGDLNPVGTAPANYLVVIDINTGDVLNWNIDTDAWVYDLVADGSTVYVGGYFTSIGGVSRNYLAAIDATTGVVSAWNPDANNEVLAIAVRNGIVYAGGNFSSIGGITRYGLVALDGNGTVTDWNPEDYPGYTVSALAASSDTVYVGSSFTYTDLNNGVSYTSVVSIDLNGNVKTWNPGVYDGVSFPPFVTALAVDGSAVYAGGTFTMYGGAPRDRLAAFDANGNLTDWSPSADRLVYTLTVSGTTVYAGGLFYQINGVSQSYIAAIDASGSLINWNPNANGSVRTIKISGSTVYVGGDFTSMGGATRNRIVALDATATATAWDPNANQSVDDLEIVGNTVYAGGVFTNIGGADRNYIAALDINSGAATAWDPSAGSAVYDIAVDGSTIYAGGIFTTIGGQSRNYLAALDATGNATLWDPSPNGYVNTLALSGSTLYVGGNFSYIVGNTQRRHLAAFDGTGNLTSWDPDTDDNVASIAIGSSKVYAGGYFTTVGGNIDQYFVSIEP
jgi:hypothetical protein